MADEVIFNQSKNKLAQWKGVPFVSQQAHSMEDNDPELTLMSAKENGCLILFWSVRISL